MKSRIAKWIISLIKKMRRSPSKAFGLLETVIGITVMIVVLLAIGQMQKSAGGANLNANLMSDFNAAITHLQSILNNATTCQSMFSNVSLSQTTAGPIKPAQTLAPLLMSGATGAPVLKLGKMGNNLNITNMEFNHVTPLASPDQYVVNLHIAASKILPGGAIGNSTLTHDFSLVFQTDPSAGNLITDCLGQGGNSSFWTLGPGPNKNIYYLGKVGIGTNNPRVSLDVAGGVSVSGGNLLVNSHSMPLSLAAGASQGVVGLMIGYTAGAGWIQSYSASTGLILEPYGGNVGVAMATTLPQYNLEVAGFAGLSTGTSWVNISDIRLKDILGDYEYGLKEVLQLHPVRFQYKKDNALKLQSDKKFVGFIAQEVQDIIPDAVHKNKENGYLDLNADPIHWAAVNAIQELYALIEPFITDENQNLISEFELENAKLKEENSIVKNFICAKDANAPFCK